MHAPQPTVPERTDTPQITNHDSGIWRGQLTDRYADEYGADLPRDVLNSAIHEANVKSVDQLKEELMLANKAWFLSTVADVPLSFTKKSDDAVPTQEITADQLSLRTKRLQEKRDWLGLALAIRIDDDQHPSVFGRKAQ